MLVNGVVLAVNYALIALGITLIFSIMNILNFAHGQMFMIGGFVVYYLYGIFQVNYFVSLVAVVIVLGVDWLVFRDFLFQTDAQNGNQRRELNVTRRWHSVAP